MDTVAADKPHRGHAIIEQVHVDLKNSALAHLPSASFSANSAWTVLAVMAFNLTRVAATLAGEELVKATATVRRKLINVPTRTASSARKITLHLPTAWPWESAWSRLFTRVCGPPTVVATRPSRRHRRNRRTQRNTLKARSGDHLCAPTPTTPHRRARRFRHYPSVNRG